MTIVEEAKEEEFDLVTIKETKIKLKRRKFLRAPPELCIVSQYALGMFLMGACLYRLKVGLFLIQQP